MTAIKRDISFSGIATEEQKERLLSIADKCPISKLLTHQVSINTKFI